MFCLYDGFCVCYYFLFIFCVYSCVMIVFCLCFDSVILFCLRFCIIMFCMFCLHDCILCVVLYNCVCFFLVFFWSVLSVWFCLLFVCLLPCHAQQVSPWEMWLSPCKEASVDGAALLPDWLIDCLGAICLHVHMYMCVCNVCNFRVLFNSPRE